MDGKTGLGRNNRKSKFIKSYKGPEVVERYGCQHHEGTWHIKEKEKVAGMQEIECMKCYPPHPHPPPTSPTPPTPPKKQSFLCKVSTGEDENILFLSNLVSFCKIYKTTVHRQTVVDKYR